VKQAAALSNIEVVQGAYEQFREIGEINHEFVHEDFVWDMSHYTGWPEQQVYYGPKAATRFMNEWRDSWDEWQWEIRSLHAAEDKVVAVLHQAGRSKSTGIRVEMDFAQVFTVEHGRQRRMDMYSDPREALAAAGIKP
jgi:ketosteroid isomerase-like protein